MEYTVGCYDAVKELFEKFELRGKRILDIGAGQSNITAHLRENGAESFAIDLAYISLDKLDRATTHAMCEAVKSGRLDSKYCYIFEKARDEFRRDQMKNSHCYISANATHLPFEANSMDLMYSGSCISTVLNENLNELNEAMNEVVRVLRPRGTAIIVPYDYLYNLEKSINLDIVLNRLQHMPYIQCSFYEIDVLPRSKDVLVMRKLKAQKTKNYS